MPAHKEGGPGERAPNIGSQGKLRDELKRLAPAVSLRDPLIGMPVTGSKGGTYRIMECLGTGGMGSVYKAERQLEGGPSAPVAVKFLSHTFCKDRELRERFRKEAEALGRIDHPNVVKVIDTGELENGDPFFVMEHVDGEDLDRVLARRKHLSWREAKQVFLQVCDGLHATHSAGIVHRDLKPANIRIEKGSNLAKLMDFGLAKNVNTGHRLTVTGTALGTPDYMAPEQAGGSKDLDHRADIYSFSVLMYHTLSGSPLFDGSSFQEIMFKHATESPVPVRQRRPDLNIPEGVEALVMAGLRKNPSERFQSMVELREAMLKCGEDTQEGAPFPPPEFDKRGHMDATGGSPIRRVAIVAAAFIAIAAVCTIAFLGYQGFRKHLHGNGQTTYLKADGTWK
jgi:serine/threonine protein kinase